MRIPEDVGRDVCALGQGAVIREQARDQRQRYQRTCVLRSAWPGGFGMAEDNVVRRRMQIQGGSEVRLSAA